MPPPLAKPMANGGARHAANQVGQVRPFPPPLVSARVTPNTTPPNLPLPGRPTLTQPQPLRHWGGGDRGAGTDGERPRRAGRGGEMGRPGCLRERSWAKHGPREASGPP